MRGSVFSYEVKGGKGKAWGFVHPVSIGATRQVRRRGFSRKADAEKALNTSLLKMRTGHTFERGQTTLIKAVEEYIADKRASGINTKGSLLVDSKALDHLADSPIAEVKLDQLNYEHGCEFVRHLAGKGLKPASIWLYVGKIRAAFNHYSEIGHIHGQPWRKIRIARVTEPMVCLNLEEIARIKSALAGTRWLDPFVVAVSTGLRRAELLRLTWQNYDGKALTIPAAITKTKKARRIELFPDAKETIERRRAENISMILRHKEWNRAGLIFCHHQTGGEINENAFSANFRSWANTHLKGFRHFRWHDLRHTHASILLQLAKWPITAVAERLGHASPAMTLKVYSHLLPQSDYLIDQGAEIFHSSGKILEIRPLKKTMLKA